MRPPKDDGPGPPIGEAEAETLVPVAQENAGLSLYSAGRPVSQFGTFQRLDSVIARIIQHMTREEGREAG